jgi:L-lactate dehydrogenase
LFNSTGLDADKAKSVAANLVLTDMMGRATHGLAQCGAYLDQIVNGNMTKSGAPQK